MRPPVEQEIRPESLLAELRSAQVYDAKRRLQVAQEEVVKLRIYSTLQYKSGIK